MVRCGIYRTMVFIIQKRLVFDCSASFCGMSFNNELMQGPNFTSTLLGESMFHQVNVTEPDKDFLRFLWWPKRDVSQGFTEYRMTVHLFAIKSSSICACYALVQSVAVERSKVWTHITKLSDSSIRCNMQ